MPEKTMGLVPRIRAFDEGGGLTLRRGAPTLREKYWLSGTAAF